MRFVIAYASPSRLREGSGMGLSCGLAIPGAYPQPLWLRHAFGFPQAGGEAL